MFCRCVIVLSVLEVLFAGAESVSAAALYHLTDLGTLCAGAQSQAHDINADGQVVGDAYFTTGRHAFLSTATMMQDLGSLGRFSTSRGINTYGQVVGYAEVSFGDDHAFLYTNGAMQDLGTLPGGRNSQAESINSEGKIVGYSESAAGKRAFLYSNDVMYDLGTLGGNLSFGSRAFDINDNGQIVGYTGTPSTPYYHAFLYEGNTMHDLGTLHGSSTEWSQAHAINIHGEVVGSASVSSRAHPFLYSNGVMQDLGTLPGGNYSSAQDINANSEIVGWGYTAPALSNPHAFYYANGAMIDLNDWIDTEIGWTLLEANAINDIGQIVGRGKNTEGQSRAFLLTPIPEPCTLNLLCLGVLILLNPRLAPAELCNIRHKIGQIYRMAHRMQTSPSSTLGTVQEIHILPHPGRIVIKIEFK